MKKRIPFHYKQLIYSYLLLIVLSTSYRLILLTTNFNNVFEINKQLLIKAFSVGYTFDNIVISYTLVLPFLLTVANSRLQLKSIYSFNKYFLSIITILLIIIYSIDLPYFNYYNARINTSIFAWIKSPISSFKIISKDTNYYPYVFLGVLFGVLYLKYGFTKLWKTKQDKTTFWSQLIFAVTFTVALFHGIRGSFDFDRTPINMKDAYFSEESFYNLLAINPTYNLIDNLSRNNGFSISDSKALRIVQNSMNTTSDLPFNREIKSSRSFSNKNVILIIMESMSANKVGFINNTSLTPTLDSISKLSVTFPNTFTSGIHTHNGIFSTLYGYPANMTKLPMYESITQNISYYGLPHILKKKGYTNMFFCSTKKDFDNMGNFFKPNGYDKNIFDYEFYPKDSIVNCWGVNDLTMLKHTIPKLNSEHSKGKPFFATYMTISTHTPHIIPPYFSPKAKSKIDQAYEFADWSINEFLKEAQKQDWYDNSLFVFVADHGQNFNPVYSMPLNYHHSPMIFFTPDASLNAEMNNKPALQIDLMPTTLALLGGNHMISSPGINLMANSRKYCYFTADNQLGVLDDQYFFIKRNDGGEGLYTYKNRSKNNIILDYPTKKTEMYEYGIAHLQTADYYTQKNLIKIDTQ